MLTIEVKFRFVDELKSWNERKVMFTFDVTNYDSTFVDVHNLKVSLHERVMGLTKHLGAVESRWNVQGQDQGHYNFAE